MAGWFVAYSIGWCCGLAELGYWLARIQYIVRHKGLCGMERGMSDSSTTNDPQVLAVVRDSVVLASVIITTDRWRDT